MYYYAKHRGAEDKGIPDPNILLLIPASASDAAAVNLNGTKALLANGLITFSIRGNLVFSNGPSSLEEILLIAAT